MSSYKHTPITINTSDTTEYLAWAILQSTATKVLDFLIFLGSCNSVDQNKNLAKSRSTMPSYRCASSWANASGTIGSGCKN